MVHARASARDVRLRGLLRARGMARSRGLLPRRYLLRTLPRGIPPNLRPGDEIRGDLQRLRGFLRRPTPSRRRTPTDAAPARLRNVFRVPAPRRRVAPESGPDRGWKGLRTRHLQLQRSLALSPRRHCPHRVHIAADDHHGRTHRQFHQRFRRGTDGEQRRIGHGRGLCGYGRLRQQLYGRSGICFRRPPRSPRVGD